jgi:hypothetical protein
MEVAVTFSVAVATIIFVVAFVVVKLLGIKVKSWSEVWDDLYGGVLGLCVLAMIFGFYIFIGHAGWAALRAWFHGLFG